MAAQTPPGLPVTEALAKAPPLDLGLWAAVAAAWGILEWRGVRKHRGAWVPFTDLIVWVRGSRRNPPYWMLLGLWVWLGKHIFLDH